MRATAKWNSGRKNSGWITGSCTTKNSRTTWVRGCRTTSWKTWGCKTKYSHTNSVKDKVHGKTKYSRMNCVKKNSWQFAFNILCNVFDFLFENLPLNKTYVFSCIRLMICFVWNINKTRKVSLLRYQTPRSLLKKRGDIFQWLLRSYSQYI